MQQYLLKWQKWGRDPTLTGCTHLGVGNDGLLAQEDAETNLLCLLECKGEEQTWLAKSPSPSAVQGEESVLLCISNTAP